MAQLSRAQLGDVFITGYKPTQTDFANAHESMLNLTDDRYLLSVRPFDAARDYEIGETVIYGGLLYTALADKAAATAFIPANWQVLGVPVAANSFPTWDPMVTYPVNAYVEYNLRIYKSLQNANTSHLPTNVIWWVEVSAASYGTIPVYAEGAYPEGGVMEYRNRLWRATESFASTVATWEAEVLAGKWVEVKPYLGVPDYIAAWDTLRISAGYQHLVYGAMNVDGAVDIDGQINIL